MNFSMKEEELSSKILYFDGNSEYYFRSEEIARMRTREKIILSTVGTKDGIYQYLAMLSAFQSRW
jgi:hypothetical protein